MHVYPNRRIFIICIIYIAYYIYIYKLPFLIIIYCHLFYINYIFTIIRNKIYKIYLYGNICYMTYVICIIQKNNKIAILVLFIIIALLNEGAYTCKYMQIYVLLV